MAIRPFGYQTLGAAPQPAFGSKVATAFNVTPDQYTGMTDPRSNPSSAKVAVTTGQGLLFRINDNIMIGVQGGPYDFGTVVGISGDTLTVQGLVRSHAVGEFIIIAVPAAEISIQANANTLYIGNDSLTAATTSPGIYRAVAPGNIYNPGSSNVGSVKGTGAYWVWGTSGDTYLPGLDTV